MAFTPKVIWEVVKRAAPLCGRSNIAPTICDALAQGHVIWRGARLETSMAEQAGGGAWGGFWVQGDGRKGWGKYFDGA